MLTSFLIFLLVGLLCLLAFSVFFVIKLRNFVKNTLTRSSVYIDINTKKNGWFFNDIMVEVIDFLMDENKKNALMLESVVIVMKESNNDLVKKAEFLKKELEVFEGLALTDSLTNLGNRRFFDQELNSFFNYSKRQSQSFCLALFDVDFFKQINDTYGHKVGDLILQEVAKVFKNRVRTSDVVARLGGDEFAFILKNVSEDGLVDLLDDVYSAIDKLEIMKNKDKVHIGLLAGVACMSEVEFADSSSLYNAADVCLYESKRHGRHCWTMYSSDGNYITSKK